MHHKIRHALRSIVEGLIHINQDDVPLTDRLVPTNDNKLLVRTSITLDLDQESSRILIQNLSRYFTFNVIFQYISEELST